MGIGIGIFLGLATLGIIYLYAQTKDRWNWVKIAKRVGIAILVLISIPVVLLGGSLLYDGANNYINNRPKQVTSIEGISLGEKFSEVEFRYDVKEMPKNSDAVERAYEINGNDHLAFYVSRATNKVHRIVYLCRDNKYQSINGISCTDTSETILGKFGVKNVEIYCRAKESSEDGLSLIHI